MISTKYSLLPVGAKQECHGSNRRVRQIAVKRVGDLTSSGVASATALPPVARADNLQILCGAPVSDTVMIAVALLRQVP